MAHTYESAVLFEEIIRMVLEKREVPPEMVRCLHAINPRAFVVEPHDSFGECFRLQYANHDPSINLHGWLEFTRSFKLISIDERKPRVRKFVLYGHYTIKGYETYWHQLSP